MRFCYGGSKVVATGIQPNAGDEDGQIHINLLEFMTIIINVWFAAVLQPATTGGPTPHMGVFGRQHTAVSWVSHAARAQRPTVTRLTRFLTVFLFHLSQTTRVQATYLPGDENQDADLLSRLASRAPSWASVIEQGSPAVDLPAYLTECRANCCKLCVQSYRNP